MKPLSIKIRIILPFVIVVLFILSISILLFYKHIQSYIQSDFQIRKEKVLQTFYHEINVESKIMNGFIKLMQPGKDLQSAWMEGDRDVLLANTIQLNKTLLNSYNITHFYFHKLDQTCFLRVHNPGKFGDFIDRYTMKSAVNTLSVSSGLELGSYGTFTLRVVAPWVIDGKLEGYIELGKEIGNITDSFNNILEVEILFSINKKYLDREKWEEGLSIYDSSGAWDQFSDYVVPGNNLENISSLAEGLSQYHSKPSDSIYKFNSGNRRYLAGFIDAVDASGQSVGDIIVLKDFTFQRNAMYKTLLFLIISVLIVELFGFILLWILLGKIQRKLENANLNLIVKIKELKISKKEAVEAKAVAENANRMKNDFLANVSHELRTPLNGILGMTGLVLDTELDEDQKDFLNMIVESGDHLFRIISDLLDFSQIETGALTIKPVLFNLSNLVKNTVSVLRPAADRKKLELLYSIKPENIIFYGDRVRIGQIIINLVTNAIKYSDKGTIRIDVDLNKELVISIFDTGIGISEEKIDSIFDSFVQIENTYTKTHEGVGLGLAIVKQVVGLLNGTINLESKLGVGSTFKITLPIVSTPSGVKEIPEKSSPVSSSVIEGLRVIIAEDEAINRIYMKKFLSKKGMIVTESVNGLEVLEKMNDGDYDLILMDMGMPKLDGIEATLRIREIEKKSGKYIKIIALTANAFPEDVRRCIEAGMDHFVSKPIKEKELLEIIEETINSK